MRQPQVCKHQVCVHCGGRFGMVTHRWWVSKFCKRTCKDSYLHEVTLDRDTIRRRFGLRLTMVLLHRLLSTTTSAVGQVQTAPLDAFNSRRKPADGSREEGYASRLNRRADATSRVRCGKRNTAERRRFWNWNHRVICNGKAD
jgi:hypothetical protein